MVGLESEYTLYFQGTDELCAMVEVSIFGSASAATLDAFTGKITEIINGELGIKPARIYVQYSQKPEWGWNGSNL